MMFVNYDGGRYMFFEHANWHSEFRKFILTPQEISKNTLIYFVSNPEANNYCSIVCLLLIYDEC